MHRIASHKRSHGPADGQVDAGRMDGQAGGRVGRCPDGQADRWAHGQADTNMDMLADRLAGSWTDKQDR